MHTLIALDNSGSMVTDNRLDYGRLLAIYCAEAAKDEGNEVHLSVFGSPNDYMKIVSYTHLISTFLNGGTSFDGALRHGLGIH